MAFLTVKPPVNAQFAEAYNAIVEGCWKRGFGLDLKKKKIGGFDGQNRKEHEITSEDMQQLRDIIKEGKDQFFDRSKLKLSLPDPFSDEEAKPEINGGKGFLLMPGAYTESGESIYSEEGSASGSLPVLWEHFTDLKAVLESLTTRKYDYSVHIAMNSTDMDVQVDFNRGELSGETHDRDSSGRRAKDDWNVKYNIVPLADGEGECDFLLYFRSASKEGTPAWKLADGTLKAADAFKVNIVRMGQLVKITDPRAIGWQTECDIQPACEIKHQIELKAPDYIPDESVNGVAVEACNTCCGQFTSPYAYFKDAMSAFSGKVQIPLAISSNMGCRLQVGHYMAVFNFAGDRYGQYNCDSCIEDEFTGSGSTKKGGSTSWKFVYLRRPTGALVPFFRKGGEYHSMNNAGHSLHDNGGAGNYTLRCADGVSHIFRWGQLDQCHSIFDAFYQRTYLPGEHVKRSGSGSIYSFTSSWGMVNIHVNGRSEPSLMSYFHPAAANRRLRRASVRDTEFQDQEPVGGFTRSTDPADAEGFSPADFFPAGEAPDYGTPTAYSIMDFQNTSGALSAKYIEITFDTGIVAKGFWNKEGNTLMPAELTVFERSAPPAEDNPNPDAMLIQEKQTHIRYSANGRNEAVSVRLKQGFPFGERTVAEYRNYGTEQQREAVTRYIAAPGAAGYSRPELVTDFDGGWTRYEYDSLGRTVKVVTPFGDALPDAPEDQCRVTVYDYTPLAENEEVMENDQRIRTTIETTLGQETARRYRLYFPNESWDVTAAAPGAAYDDPANRVTKSFSYADGDFEGKVRRVENADGTVTVTSYAKLNPTVDEDGQETFELQTTTESGRLPDHGTRTVTVQNLMGDTVERTVYDLESGLLISQSSYTYDQYGRVLTETTADGDVTSTEYNCCGPRRIVAPDGSETEYAYDSFKRLKFESRAGVTTYHTYDANDNETVTTVVGSAGGELVTTRVYDADGELVSETDPAGATTAYARGAGWQETTDALGNTSRTEYFRDGSVKRISGTAAVPRSYEYGVENNERFTLARSSETEWSKSYTDFMGRSYKTVYSDGFTETTSFDACGRAVKHENSEGLKQLTVYDDATGKQKYQVTKRADALDEINWSGDAVTEFESGYRLRDGLVVSFDRTFLYHGGERQLYAVQETARDNKHSWETQQGRTASTVRTCSGDGEIEEIVTNFDGTALKNTYRNDMLITGEHSVLGDTVYLYDEFNRAVGSDHKEGGVLRSVRYTLDAAGRQLAVTESAPDLSRTVSYTYDPLGNKLTETTPEGTVTNYAYTPQGQVASISGGVYRQEYGYDAQGRLTALTTYRDDDAPQVTAYEYDARGRLKKKSYPDGNSLSYTYRGDGKLASHTNARGQEFTYSYNRAGEQLAVTGMDQSFEYDLNGRVVKVTDRAGVREFTLDAFGNVLAETVPNLPGKVITRSYDEFNRQTGLTLDGHSVAYAYGADGRLVSIADGAATLRYSYRPGTGLVEAAAWQVGEAAPFLTTAFRYDSHSRLTGITANGQPVIGYTLDKDNRRTQAALSDGSRWEYGYDPLNQLTSAERADSDGAALNAMSYRYDGIGNRTAAEEDGEAFAYASNQLNQYTAVNDQPLTYDADGNTLTTDDGWLYTWNSENRLIRAEKGSVKFEAAYDYMGRRFEKKLYDGETLTVHRKFVYDGYKLIGVYDALNNDAEELSFVWQPEAAGLDVPLSMKHDNAAYYYVTDGNKNVTALYDATGAEAANYVYGPFGQTLAANGRGGGSPAAVDYEGGKVAAICNLLSGSGDEMHRPEDLDLDMLFCMELGGDSGIGGDGNASALRTVFGMEAMDRRQYDTSTTSPLPPGGLALVNPFRFSSEFHDDELGLVYYNYRYYNPQLGRWTKRDPLPNKTIINYYFINANDILNKIDHLGEWWTNIHRDKTTLWAQDLNYLKEAAQLIGEYDEKIDSFWGWRGPLPGVGEQGYHFNRSTGGTDSRLKYYEQHLRMAKFYCSAHRYDKNHEKAGQELGSALHPLQDWVAHGEYEVTHPGPITSIHNEYSTQREFGSPGDYPDLYFLDVKNSPDGRATQNTITQRRVLSPDGILETKYDVAEYERGSKRYELTKRKTQEALRDFKRFVKSTQGSVDCKCYFFGVMK
ncbi:RHS repeat domain-containing protein [Victivallis vadensis]|uniref:RHS repeat domain-containing protein n=1 Tax=Victivallis vadensis TaxID=172901 RepID=UPI0023F45297|nr:RHS repeat-associated core domain-containing protein [Victivallis vadensis]